MSKDNNTPAKIHQRLAAIMESVGAIGKERKNLQQNFSFRGIEDVMNELHPLFSANKVYILSEILDERTEERQTKSGSNLIYRVLKVKISYVSGEDGSRESVVVVGEGMDSGDKAANKAMAAALKYALTQTLIIPYAELADGDQDSPPASVKKGPEAPAAGKPSEARRSAYDGRTLKPGESPLPVQSAAPPQQAPGRQPPPKQAQPSEASAFHTRLYDAIDAAKITETALNDYLRKRGLMTADQTIHVISPKLVTAMLDGTDKSGKNNFQLIVENIRKVRTA